MINTSTLLGRYWISSISRLPMFYEPGTIVSGMMSGDTGDEFFPASYRLWAGRDIRILDGLYKYKLEIAMTGSSQMCEIIGLSDVQFTIHNVRSVAGRFYPIYMHNENGCYVFVQTINDMFKASCQTASENDWMVVSDGNIPSCGVITPFKFCKSIADLCCVDLMPHDPILDCVANIRQDWLLTELIACAQTGDVGGEIFESTVRDFGKLMQSPFIEILKMFTGVRTTMDICNLLNPYGSVPSDVSEMCNRNFDNGAFDAIKKELINNEVLPVFTYEINCSPVESQSFVGRWLTGIFMHPASDFKFTIRADYRDCSDYYVSNCEVKRNFKWYNTQTSQDIRQLLDRIPISFDISKYGEHDYIAQRSWLEDVVIRDPDTDSIVLYIDLVVWVLACAECLINDAILSNVSTML